MGGNAGKQMFHTDRTQNRQFARMSVPSGLHGIIHMLVHTKLTEFVD